MFNNPAWFARRKYGGWGLYPKTWQGWAYIAATVAPLFIIQNLTIGTERGRLIALAVWGVIIFADFMDTMMRIPKDERETLHEALAERNALWVIVAVLGVGIAFRVAQSVLTQRMEVDPIIIAALLAGVVAKAATNVYLDRTH